MVHQEVKQHTVMRRSNADIILSDRHAWRRALQGFDGGGTEPVS